MSREVYLDNAATSYPKPLSVSQAVSSAIQRYGGNPGRSGHKMSTNAALAVYRVRQRVSAFFNTTDTGIIFTQNCTHALNTAILGVLSPYDHVITTSLEHNSVLRPLEYMRKKAGVRYTIVDVHNKTNDEIVRAIANAVNGNTKAIITTHASNVTGRIMPISTIGELCRVKCLTYIVDAAQTAGVLPIDMQRLNIDILCCAAHKSLFGIGGGILALSDSYAEGIERFIENDSVLPPLLYGGTGTNSLDLDMPDILPERYEAGTLNVPTICSIGAGIDFISRKGMATLYSHEKSLCRILYKQLSKNERIVFYSADTDDYVPIVSFTVRGSDCQELCQALSDRGFYLRSGYLCAATAHHVVGTVDTGVIRFSPSPFNTREEVLMLCSTITALLR